MPLFPVILAL